MQTTPIKGTEPMSKLMTPDQTIAALKKWNVRFKEYSGWRTRTRPGDTGQRNGLVIHHTGSNSQSDDYLHFLFVTGRPDEGIPGPLCNVSTDMDGDLHLGAAGRANHAGRGSGATLARVRAEDYQGFLKELVPGPDDTDGNGYYYGNEIRYDGASAMAPAAYRTALLHAAAVCDFHGWSALSVIGHREHTLRKNDPGHNPMDKFRRDLAAVLKAGPGNGAPNPGNTATPVVDLTIHTWSILFAATQPKPMRKTDETWGDAYQVMAFAANPKIGVITVAQRDYWVKITTTEPNWAYANRMVTVAMQKLQAKWGLTTSGLMDARTAAWFRGYGYTIINNG
jgi:hypothetical protein